MKVIGGNFVRTLHINWIDWQDIQLGYQSTGI